MAEKITLQNLNGLLGRMLTERELILANLDAFVRQRSGMDYRNYGDAASYRSEQRSITRDLRDYRTLRAAVQWREGIDAAALKEAFRAFSGRLTWDGKRMDYCTGQYFPTEYRKAACAVLASALWDYTREHAMPAPDSWRVESYGTWNGDKFEREQSAPMQLHAALALLEQKGAGHSLQEYHGGLNPGSWLRRYFRREFGRGLAARYFN